ncbi:hypothetical protein EGR_10816 [Echinococcus granulosus]|uniref:Uncharacterized protein n=1 Tax=Echinococcus granulosus TaxID=6210 RepID=W6TZZ9_ECHGR|nr:hypothetical protein EGR_10816 [Echinococcus granulosus]EUB54328.1 hypothetical protein EGR_10816 [Echinococcus granulosus]
MERNTTKTCEGHNGNGEELVNTTSGIKEGPVLTKLFASPTLHSDHHSVETCGFETPQRALEIDAQIGPIKDGTRIIRGPINSSYTLQSVLPDVYKAVIINNRSFPITNGVRTTSYFTCTYIQGRCSKILYFFSMYFKVPVKFFALKDPFINYYSAAISCGGDTDRKNFGRFKLDYYYTTKGVRGLIPNPNQPFFIDALNMTEAKLTCTFNGTGTPICRFWFLISAATIVATKYVSPVYVLNASKPANYTDDYPEIVTFGLFLLFLLFSFSIFFSIEENGMEMSPGSLSHKMTCTTVPPGSGELFVIILCFFNCLKVCNSSLLSALAPKLPVFWPVVMCASINLSPKRYKQKVLEESVIFYLPINCRLLLYSILILQTKQQLAYISTYFDFRLSSYSYDI